jgi:L-amino acid N-acyltransferase YncA
MTPHVTAAVAAERRADLERAAVTIRAAAAADAAAIAGIYNQGIAERSATFDTDPVPVEDALGWLGDERQPVLVAELDGRVVGWTRVIRSAERCAFAGVGEYTIYLDGAARGRGVGRHLLDALVSAAERAGYWKLQGRLFTTNAASIALARRCGFREVGVYERHGRLDGQWRDLLIVERLLGDAIVS